MHCMHEAISTLPLPSQVAFTEGNRIYFNAKAEGKVVSGRSHGSCEYDGNPNVRAITASIVRGLLKEYSFDSEVTSVLDFACGSGTTSRLLAPHARRILGVDISQGMVDLYNTSVVNQGIPPEEMRAVCVDLLHEDGDEDSDEHGEKLGGKTFDVIVCVLAYHHFASITFVTQRLSYFLKPGGVLLVADNLNLSLDPTHAHDDDDDNPHAICIPRHSQPEVSSPLPSSCPSPDLNYPPINPSANVVAHKHGFTSSQMEFAFLSAGLTHFVFNHRVRARTRKGSREINIFVARGQKPTTSASIS